MIVNQQERKSEKKMFSLQSDVFLMEARKKFVEAKEKKKNKKQRNELVSFDQHISSKMKLRW